MRDVTAAEAIAYICFGAWGRRFIDAANSPEISAEWEYRQFHQAAADGDIPTWAKRGGKPYEPIKREFWISNQIEWFELLKGWSVTRPIGRAIGINPRYVEVMTSRTATEGFYRNQLPEVLRAKSSARKLSNLFKEGVDHRNKLLRATSDFDATQSEQLLVAWDSRALSVIDAAGVNEGTRSRFETLDTWYPEMHGEAGRPAEQVHLETVWNKKLQILRTIIDEISRTT